ncbi:MAG: tetratricopeptide repeat protein [Nitrospirae bacterium]|nr:MAG: tetratricopeptide repeat protein [Nitrospirota bacterium]
MAIDKHAILESAQLYTSKGQFDKAIAEWKKLTTGAPADGTILNTIGDLHLKRNASAEAIEAFFQAAAAFRTGDAALKAIALYKKILKVDPGRADAYCCMGDLNAERGLVGNAVADYLILAKMLLKAGKQDEALDVYRKIAALDPTNAEAVQRLGGGAGDSRGAGQTAREQTSVSGGLRPGQGQGGGPSDGGRGAGAGKLQVSPTAEPPAPDGSFKLPPEYTRQGFLSEAIKLTSTGQFTDAETVLMEMLSREPGDPEVCRLLATLHLKRGELACAKAEFQFLAEAAMRAHDCVLAESMLLEYLKADPSCVSLCELLGRLYEQNGDAAAAAVQYGRALEALIATPDPEQATLPFELYEKILRLAPSSPLISQYAAVFPSAVSSQPVGDTAVPVMGEAGETTVVEPTEQPQEAKGGTLAFRFSEFQADSARRDEAKATEDRESRERVPSTMVFRFAGQADTPAEPEAPTEVAAESIQEPAGWGREAEGPVPAAAEPDFEEQYQLGLAYQQMGLPEAAIEALLVAINGADHFADCCRLLALCSKEQGQVQEAINYLERGLASPRPLAGEAVALLRYELGLLYEAGGQVEQALQAFSAVPTFRDVREHMARLSDGRTGDQTAPASASEALMDATPVAVGRQSAAGEASGTQKKKRRISYL